MRLLNQEIVIVTRPSQTNQSQYSTWLWFNVLIAMKSFSVWTFKMFNCNQAVRWSFCILYIIWKKKKSLRVNKLINNITLCIYIKYNIIYMPNPPPVRVKIKLFNNNTGSRFMNEFWTVLDQWKATNSRKMIVFYLT